MNRRLFISEDTATRVELKRATLRGFGDCVARAGEYLLRPLLLLEECGHDDLEEDMASFMELCDSDWKLTNEMLGELSVRLGVFDWDDSYKSEEAFMAAVRDCASRGEKGSPEASRLFLEGADAGRAGRPSEARRLLTAALVLWERGGDWD